MTEKGQLCNVQIGYDPHPGGTSASHPAFTWFCITCKRYGTDTWEESLCGWTDDMEKNVVTDVVTAMVENGDAQPNVLIALAEEKIEQLKKKSYQLEEKIAGFKHYLDAHAELVDERCAVLREIDGYLQAIKQLEKMPI